MSYLPNPPDVSRLSSARGLPHSSHWGAFSVLLRDGGIEVKPHPGDPAPSPLLDNIPASVAHRARIARPMVRRGWLERGPGPDRRRGRDAFVPLDWPRALDLAAAELQRIYSDYGPRGVYGESYGWASAGRFHDAPRQLHRFLNVAGGYVRSVGSYSSGAASVILPHVIGPQEAVAGNNVSWDERWPRVRWCWPLAAWRSKTTMSVAAGAASTSRWLDCARRAAAASNST